jgi:hypothetical protein
VPEKERAQSVVATPQGPELETTCTNMNTDSEAEGQDPEVFDWETDPAVILRGQAAVAAYFNKFGELVVKQRDTLGYEGVVYVAPENVEKFVHGLKARALPQTKLRVVEGGE